MIKIKFISTILFLVSLCFVVTTRVWALSPSEMVSAVNSTRTRNGLALLSVSGRLQSAAALKLSDMQQYRYWAHNNPQTGAVWTSFIRKTGYEGVIGENLASNYGSAGEVITGWLNSPAHKANLLSGTYHEVGIAIGMVNFGNGDETVVVAEFGAGKALLVRR